MRLVQYKVAASAGTGLIILAAAAGIRAQGPCRLVLPEPLRNEAITQKAEIVSAILDDLAARRQTFMTTGANVELSPTLYYHATLAEFRHAATLSPDEAETVLEIIIAFYDAYEHNRSLSERRGVDGVEKHWRSYYRTASKTGALEPLQFTRHLLDGVDAHLADLSRTLRYIFKRMKLSSAAMSRLYFSMDTMFEQIAKATEADIRVVRKDPLMTFESNFGLSSIYVVHARHRAWEGAVGKAGLRASKTLPVMPHEKRSRTFFSLTPQAGCNATSF